jgi:hypothetical protein
MQVSLDLQPSWEPYLHALPEPDGVEPEAIYGAAKGGGAAKAGRAGDDDDDDGDLPPVASLFGLGARKASWADAMDEEEQEAEAAAAAAKVGGWGQGLHPNPNPSPNPNTLTPTPTQPQFNPDQAAREAAKAKAEAEGRDTYRFAQWDIKAGVTAQDAAGGTLDLCLVSNVLVYCTDEPSADVLAALLTSGVQAVLLNERGAEQKMVQMDARTFTLTPTFQPPNPYPRPPNPPTVTVTPNPNPNFNPNPSLPPTRSRWSSGAVLWWPSCSTRPPPLGAPAWSEHAVPAAAWHRMLRTGLPSRSLSL